jgi:hypothetical protein
MWAPITVNGAKAPRKKQPAAEKSVETIDDVAVMEGPKKTGDESNAAQPRANLVIAPQSVVLRHEAGHYIGEFTITGENASFKPAVEGDLQLTLSDGELWSASKQIPRGANLDGGKFYRLLGHSATIGVECVAEQERAPRINIFAAGDPAKPTTVRFQFEQPNGFVPFLRTNRVPLLAALCVILLGSAVLLYVLLHAKTVRLAAQKVVGPAGRIPELMGIRQPRADAAAAGVGAAPAISTRLDPAGFEPQPHPVDVLRKRVDPLQDDLQKAAELFASQKRVDDLDQSLRQAIAQLGESIQAARKDNDGQLERLRSDLIKIQTTLKQVQEASGGYWPLLFSDALNADPPFQKDAQEAQQRLIEFFRNAVPGGDGLAELSANARALQQALHKTVEWTSGAYPSSSILPRLAAIEEAAGELCRQTDVMRDNLADRRLRLRFDFTLPSFPGARQNIFDGLTTGLTAEVAKWQDPVAYMSARLEELCITAAPLAADLVDRETDSQRSNSELQALLRKLFDTAGLQEIVVKQRQAFQPAYHSAVQIVPGRSPEDQSQTVAQLAARGFLRRGEVFRKASVVLYK